MARTPTPADLPETPLRPTREVIAPPRDPTNEAVARLAGAVGGVANRIADQQNELAMTRADTESAVELDAIAERYRTDDDWETAPARARAEAAKLLAERGAGLRGALTQQAWAQRAQQRLANFETGMREQSRRRGAELTVAELIRLGETSETIAGDLSLSETARQDAVTNYAAMIERAEERGLIGADDAARLETSFADRVRARVREGLRAEIIERIDLDPDELAEELRARGEGPFAQLEPEEAARFEREARRAAASLALDEALEHTLRTGDIVGENDPRLAGRWAHLGDGARLRYAGRAADMAQMHRLAASMGEMAGLSLSEIAARADVAQRAEEGAAARALLRLIRRDPAGYTMANHPNISRLRTQMQTAYQAAQAAPGDAEAQSALVRARRAYAAGMVSAQEAQGLSRGDIRIYSRAEVSGWARRVRARPPAQQQQALDALPGALLRMYGDEDLARQAELEHLEAFYGDQAGMNAPAPEPAAAAANGYDPEQVLTQIEAQIRAGSSIDDPLVRTLISRLPANQRQRVEETLRAQP
jgi:hypothetical protein